MKSTLNKIFTWSMVAFIVISVAILVWGFSVGFEYKDNLPVDVLLALGYIMIGLALAAVIVVGLIVGAMNNPKSLIKTGIVLVGVALIALVAYFIAPGSPAVGTDIESTASTLKLTDTILYLTYFAGIVAILSIVAGEIRLAISNRKA